MVLELGLTDPATRLKYGDTIHDFFKAEVQDRRADPRDDLITALCNTEVDGQLLPDPVIVGMCNLQLVAGIDTTWSSIGSALWHFAGHEDDRRRMAGADDDLWGTAVEELLRAYSPVTMARTVMEPVEISGASLQPGDKVLMNFPGANHDPEVFEDPDTVILDRQRNRHIAFGAGIHRCAGFQPGPTPARITISKAGYRFGVSTKTTVGGQKGELTPSQHHDSNG